MEKTSIVLKRGETVKVNGSITLVNAGLCTEVVAATLEVESAADTDANATEPNDNPE